MAKKKFFPLKSNIVNAIAAMLLMMHPHGTNTSTTISEFIKDLKKSKSLNSLIYESRDGSTGMSVRIEKGIAYLYISVSLLKDEENANRSGKSV